MTNRLTRIILPAIAVLAMISCKKENEPSGRELLGVWVDVDHRSDTLVISREAGGVVLFDNSMAYRTHPRSAEIINSYKWFVRLQEDEIGIAWYNPPAFLAEFTSHPFKWIEWKNRFEIESLTFRPYISCLGCKLRFEKVK